jgi:hypothetical protein
VSWTNSQIEHSKVEVFYFTFEKSLTFSSMIA